ncbi:MAG: hypothetical protein ACRDN0_24940, partial [Trebonia sp.]
MTAAFAGTVAVIGAAFVVGMPHPVTRCDSCRGEAVRYTAFAVACPVLALNLAVTTTDTPVIALMLLSLALSARSGGIWRFGCSGRVVASAVSLGLACAMKPTAWSAVLVIGAMLRTRDGTKAALTFAATTLGVAGTVMLPAVIANPGAMVDNAVLFPLGLT